MKVSRMLGLSAVIGLSFLAVGCDWVRSITLGDSMQIVHKSQKLTLAWDPPLSDFGNRSTEVKGYQIFYRDHGTMYWHLLDEIEASANPEYTVDHSVLGDGLFDFAVRAVTVDGKASNMHSSLDGRADPVSGWYVLWACSN